MTKQPGMKMRDDTNSATAAVCFLRSRGTSQTDIPDKIAWIGDLWRSPSAFPSTWVSPATPSLADTVPDGAGILPEQGCRGRAQEPPRPWRLDRRTSRHFTSQLLGFPTSEALWRPRPAEGGESAAAGSSLGSTGMFSMFGSKETNEISDRRDDQAGRPASSSSLGPTSQTGPSEDPLVSGAERAR